MLGITKSQSIIHIISPSRRRELNPGPLPYQGSALPLSYVGNLERKTGLKPATLSLEG